MNTERTVFMKPTVYVQCFLFKGLTRIFIIVWFKDNDLTPFASLCFIFMGSLIKPPDTWIKMLLKKSDSPREAKKKVPTLVEPLPLNFGYKVGFFVLDFNQLKHLKRKVLKSIYIRMSFRKMNSSLLVTALIRPSKTSPPSV